MILSSAHAGFLSGSTFPRAGCSNTLCGVQNLRMPVDRQTVTFRQITDILSSETEVTVPFIAEMRRSVQNNGPSFLSVHIWASVPQLYLNRIGCFMKAQKSSAWCCPDVDVNCGQRLSPRSTQRKDASEFLRCIEEYLRQRLSAYRIDLGGWVFIVIRKFRQILRVLGKLAGEVVRVSVIKLTTNSPMVLPRQKSARTGYWGL